MNINYDVIAVKDTLFLPRACCHCLSWVAVFRWFSCFFGNIFMKTVQCVVCRLETIDTWSRKKGGKLACLQHLLRPLLSAQPDFLPAWLLRFSQFSSHFLTPVHNIHVQPVFPSHYSWKNFSPNPKFSEFWEDIFVVVLNVFALVGEGSQLVFNVLEIGH